MYLPKVSVIVPVFNTEPFLEKCLNSLKNQTLKEIEIIVINDGSSDNSDKIIRSYIKQDKRFNLISFNSNKGTFKARLEGILLSKGEYISTVDSDDWVDEKFCEILYSKATLYDADIIGCKIWATDEIFSSKFEWVDYGIKYAHGSEILENVLKRKIWHIMANKLFKSKLIKENTEFLKSINDKIIIADDKLLSIPLFACANNYHYIDDRLYFYRQRTSSSSNNRKLDHDIMHIRDTYNVDKNIEKYIMQFPHLHKHSHILFKNREFEIMLALKNISFYNKPCERDALYKELIKNYKEESIKIMHKKLGVLGVSYDAYSNESKTECFILILNSISMVDKSIVNLIKSHYPLFYSIYTVSTKWIRICFRRFS